MNNANLINARFVMKNDTAANWAASTLILLKGEMGIEIDTGRIKFGDGTNLFKDLPYSNLLASDIKEDSHYEYTSDGTQTDSAILAANIVAPKKGDTASIVKTISGDKKSYTGYVFDGQVWKAMDGNYNAENVYFDENISITTAVGNISLTNGQGTIPALGKNIKEVFESIWTKEDLDPDKTNPTCSITMNGLSSDSNKEVGETVNISYTTNFSAGSYQYGPDTGITAKTYTVSNGTAADNKNTATGSFDTITMADTNDASKDQYSSYRLSVAVDYDGSIYNAKTNLGNDTSINIGDGTTTTSYSKYYKSYRAPFWGYRLDTNALANPEAITSDIVRGFATEELVSGYKGGKGTSTAGVPSSYTVPANTKQVYFVVKAGTKASLSVKNETSLNAPVAFTKKASHVQVKGANDFAGTAYDLWYANFDNATTGSAKLVLTWA